MIPDLRFGFECKVVNRLSVEIQWELAVHRINYPVQTSLPSFPLFSLATPSLSLLPSIHPNIRFQTP